MKKFSEITEGLWDGIVDRGTTGKVRKEDDVDSMDIYEFYDYLKSHYTIYNGSITITDYELVDTEYIYIPIINVGRNKLLLQIQFDKNEKEVKGIVISEKMNARCMMKFKQALERKYHVRMFDGFFGCEIVDIKIKNSTCIDVINMIINNVENSRISRKSQIDEGLWDGIVDRGTTGKVRKEDDVNNLNMDGLFEYIKNHYIYKEGSKLKFYHTGRFGVRGNMQVSIKTLTSSRGNKYIPTVIISYNKESEKIENLTLTSGADEFKDAVETIKKKYPVRLANDSATLYIDSSDDFEITNKVFIDVINIIIDNVEDPELLRK